MSKKKYKKNLSPEFIKNIGNIKKKVRYTDDQIIQALIMMHGNVSGTAKKLGYSPSHLRTRICHTPKIKEALPIIRDNMLDELETKLDDHIFSKDRLDALKFKMNAQGKQRGYGSTGLDINVKSEVTHQLDQDQLESLVDKFQEKLEEIEIDVEEVDG